MNKEKKLEKVRKSSNGVRIASKVVAIAGVVVSSILLISAICMFIFHEKIDSEYLNSGNVEVSFSMGGVNVIPVKATGFEGLVPTESSIPAFQQMIDDNKVAVFLGFYCIVFALLSAGVAVVFFMIESAFKSIIKEGTPFADIVIKRVTISLIILTVVLLLTTSVAFGVVMALLTWTVYTILDYGRALQIESDETL